MTTVFDVVIELPHDDPFVPGGLSRTFGMTEAHTSCSGHAAG